MGRAEDLFDRLVRDGETAIDQLIADRVAEELFLDFKRSGDNGAGRTLDDSDRRNLARAISGFGNSEGGVLIWGIECKDLPTTKYPLQDPPLFVSRLQGAVSACTVPAHPLVQHHPIVAPGKTEGYAITLIPKSDLAPHQTLKPSLQYYIRAGSDFVPTPHAVLAGMFGRRPQAGIHHMWGLNPAELQGSDLVFAFGVQLATYGPGVIRDLYISLLTGPRYGKYLFQLELVDTRNWSGHRGLGSVHSFIANEGYRLAPGTLIEPVKLWVHLSPPFDQGIDWEITYGHGESPVHTMTCIFSGAELEDLYEQSAAHLSDGKSAWETPFQIVLVDRLNDSRRR